MVVAIFVNVLPAYECFRNLIDELIVFVACLLTYIESGD